MRTTINIDDGLLEKARKFTGIEEKTALIHKALQELVTWEASKRLIALGGTMPDATAGRRRRSPKVR
jgi:Arc/MetJ family transcription regulator